MTETRLLGFDVSSNQGFINFDELDENHPEALFAGIRAGISWGYTDKWFSRNWAELKRIRRKRTAYHVLYPGENATRQMDHFFRILGDDIGELPLTEDVELDHSQSKRTITNRVIECARIIELHTGRLPFLYSRTSWLIEHTYPQELAFLPYWPAQYLFTPGREHAGPPDLPPGFENYVIQQTSDKMPAASFGVPAPPNGTLTIDYDRFNGTEADLLALCGETPIELPWEWALTEWANKFGYDGPDPRIPRS